MKTRLNWRQCDAGELSRVLRVVVRGARRAASQVAGAGAAERVAAHRAHLAEHALERAQVQRVAEVAREKLAAERRVCAVLVSLRGAIMRTAGSSELSQKPSATLPVYARSHPNQPTNQPTRVSIRFRSLCLRCCWLAALRALRCVARCVGEQRAAVCVACVKATC